MLQILKYYWQNSIKLQWGITWFFKHYILYPGILVVLGFLAKKYLVGYNIINPEWRRNIVNMFAIVSWFLLTGLSVILSNTVIREDKKEMIKKKYKVYIQEFGNGKISEWLSKFKLSILLDTILLLWICILLAVIVTIFQAKWIIIYLMLYFLFVLFVGLLTLIRQILTYLSIVEFGGR